MTLCILLCPLAPIRNDHGDETVFRVANPLKISKELLRHNTDYTNAGDYLSIYVGLVCSILHDFEIPLYERG